MSKINYFNHQNKFVVYGLGISGLSSIRFLAQNFSNELIATNDDESVIKKVETQLKNLPNSKTKIRFLKPQDIDFDKNTIIINSPGIPVLRPPHPILTKALNNGAKIICDIELFYHINNSHNFIAITGTNGKSTISTLINDVLQNIGLNSELGGNIGVACFDLPQSKESKNYVLEISSYQIDLLKTAKFQIAALTNITPDHIERYGSFEHYCHSKKQIFARQNKEDFAIINIDNEPAQKIFNELQDDNNFQSHLIPISTNKIIADGLSFIDGVIYNNILHNKSQFKIKPKFLIGKHNAENIAIAFASIFCNIHKNYSDKLNSSSITKIISIIENFKGLKHRLQFLGKINDIAFYNDSKATNAKSTSFALKSCDNIFWILGGRSKSGGIDSLVPFFNKIKKAYLVGESSDDFAKILDKHNISYEKCQIIEKAVKKAFIDAKNYSLSQKTILLSPACSSFDQWQNFEQRGNHFCEIFDKLATK